MQSWGQSVGTIISSSSQRWSGQVDRSGEQVSYNDEITDDDDDDDDEPVLLLLLLLWRSCSRRHEQNPVSDPLPRCDVHVDSVRYPAQYSWSFTYQHTYTHTYIHVMYMQIHQRLLYYFVLYALPCTLDFIYIFISPNTGRTQNITTEQQREWHIHYCICYIF